MAFKQDAHSMSLRGRSVYPHLGGPAPPFLGEGGAFGGVGERVTGIIREFDATDWVSITRNLAQLCCGSFR